MAPYVFRTEWHVAASPDAVYAALADVAAYPSWWPQVVGARWIDEHRGEVRCRSLLPFELVFVARREVEDPVNRVLSAEVTGDLQGRSRWTVQPNAAGAIAVFDEEVDVRKRLVKHLGLLGRPALRYNHDRMMRSGERGLRRLLVP